jgi:hypothetical protein
MVMINIGTQKTPANTEANIVELQISETKAVVGGATLAYSSATLAASTATIAVPTVPTNTSTSVVVRRF